MKLRCPPGCGSASHGGYAIEIDTDGFVDVEENVADVLQAHGFTRVPDAERTPKVDPQSVRLHGGVDQLKRGELFALLKEKGVSVSLPITNEELRVLAKGS